MNEQETTRDIALEAKLLINHHMTDCDTFRQNLRNDLCEFREDIKKLYWRVALILGGLMLSAHVVDWLLVFAGKK